jgi:UDP-N-acetylglucosamine 2-epimerase (non-hydrolysing)
LSKPKIAVIIGTRPCIIKQWSPYVNLKKNPNLDIILVHSNQHDNLGLQAQNTFGITPNYVCAISPDERLQLGRLTSILIAEFTELFRDLKPDMVLVHGDTTTAFAAAEAAFLNQITISHVEAGLRTSAFELPFPEEGFRRQISRISTIHFAPTSKSARNLYEEGVNKGVYVVGNSVVDALKYVSTLPLSIELKRIEEWLDIMYDLVLVTCHRRESYGEPLKNLCNSIKAIANSNEYVRIVWPVHPNSKVKDVVYELEHDQILLVEPQEYSDFVHLMEMSNLIITDSGGVVEEAAVMGKPTLILREETERPEALALDNVRLVGYDFKELEHMAKEWLTNPPKSEASDIFGIGDTGLHISEIIGDYFNAN